MKETVVEEVHVLVVQLLDQWDRVGNLRSLNTLFLGLLDRLLQLLLVLDLFLDFLLFLVLDDPGYPR